jgi:hypothetical protein
MPFNLNDVADDDSFFQESDPVLKKAITRTAGASILQDIMMKTYWANTSGKSAIRYPGSHHMYIQELDDNMNQLLRSKMPYRSVEEYLVTLGYEADDIRSRFQELTGLDPVQLEFMRTEDVKDTPSNIPWYNLGWGYAKSGKDASFFVMPSSDNLFAVFHQKDDMTRELDKSFLRIDEALKHLESKVKRVHRYDMSSSEQVEDAEAKHPKEPQKKEYTVWANYLYDLQKRGELDNVRARSLVNDAVRGGALSEEEGETMFSVYADAVESGSAAPNPEHASTPADPGHVKELKDSQTNRRVVDEMDKDTPQRFFDKVVQRDMPDREMDEVATDNVKSVLSYIKNKASDLAEFKINLYSLEYRQHKAPRTMVEVDPQTGRPSGPPKATISAILEIQDATLPEEKSKKFALAVFFVNSDGEVTTSDSVKGEDDIIYGFTEDGMTQYFSRERLSK